MLPSDFAPWQTLYYYFSKWKNEGLLEEIFDTLRGIVSRLSGRKEHIVVDTLRLPMSVRVIRLMFMTVSERKRCSNP